MLTAVVITATVTTVATAVVTVLIGYLKWTRPALRLAGEYRRQVVNLTNDLAAEQRLVADMLKWVEVECREVKALRIELAIKQRLAERLHLLEREQEGR